MKIMNHEKYVEAYGENSTKTNNVNNGTNNDKKEEKKEENKDKKEEKDDDDRSYCSTFEDDSIDLVCQGNIPLALSTLYKGLTILEHEENLKWSVRYHSSAHLSIYQILQNIHENDENGENGENGEGDEDDGSSRRRKRNKIDRILNENCLEHGDDNDTTVTTVTTNNTHANTNNKVQNANNRVKNANISRLRYHLCRAHSLNLLLQGPLTPDSQSTEKLMKKHNFL